MVLGAHCAITAPDGELAQPVGAGEPKIPWSRAEPCTPITALPVDPTHSVGVGGGLFANPLSCASKSLLRPTSHAWSGINGDENG